ncbi:hypothetical protein Ccrd_000270 [Cynara cardunculus var. scolymus]|uniref:AB hydrolase-1 domain-containing protein n=1 Tax=Cynara cardunculus var. scolymus TaxID=59895 RepID=A0A103XVH6_CYNCS|nr:hypothetical protein Ccrd_000270 [Cynara cardunculus var. scolymus]
MASSAMIQFQSHNSTAVHVPSPLHMASSSSTALRRLCFQLPFRRLPPVPSLRLTSVVRIRAFSTHGTGSEISVTGEKVTNKPPICTADELHYVSVKNSDWKLALWRYHPSPQAKPRNHPLLLLSGVGTNAIGYDLSPEFSFARYMCEQGFDTWILEVRGAGLSVQGSNPKEIEQSAHAISDQMEAVAVSGAEKVLSTSQSSASNESSPKETGVAMINQDPTGPTTEREDAVLVTKLTETFIILSDRVSGFLSEGQSRIISAKLFDQFSKLVADSFLAERFDEIRKNLLSLLEVRQNSAVASQIRDLSQKLIGIIEEGQRTVSPPLFDLQERLSTTIEDFQKQLDLIVKYDWDFDHYLEEDVPAAADPAQALNVPIVPLGALLTAAYPLTSRPPYVLSWLNHMISAQDMMHPDLLKKLVLNNFCTIPAKLLLQLASAFREGGLCDRSGVFFYKDHIHKINIPVLAVAGDQDAICPPEAVQDTVKLIPENLVTYKVFGKAGGPHYAHYDLVGGRLVVDEVYPCVVQFLSHHDKM